MAIHSSVLAWRIPGTGEPGGLLSMGSHRVGHDWKRLSTAAAAWSSQGKNTEVACHLLQIAVKRREAKSKGEKKRYKHLNAEFQRITRRDKKSFLSDQCKEIEENKRMGKNINLFKKIEIPTEHFMQKWAR